MPVLPTADSLEQIVAVNSKEIEAFIRNAGAASYPNEACGFIISKGKKSVAIEVKNEAANPREFFLINPEAYIEAEEQGEILAVWHTHTNGNIEPTEADLAGCEASGVTWLLLNVYKRTDCFEYSPMVVFEPSGYEAPFVGRPYIFGTFDCWTLVVDYLERTHGIRMSNDYPRIDGFWRKDGSDFFDSCFSNEGLIEVQDEPKDGDVFMFQTDATGKASHVAVYVGDDKILHHVQGRLSQIDIYGGYWTKHTIRHLRHESKC